MSVTGLTRPAAMATMSLALAGIIASPAAAAVAFIGRDVPTTVTIAPGATGAVPWTYQNTGGSGLLPSSGIRVVFTAPGNTVFTPQATVPSQYSDDGSNWRNNNVGLRNCTLSAGNTTLACEGYGINGSRSSWPSGGYFRFSPQITVAASAPAGATLPPGAGSFHYTDPSNGTDYAINDGTLNVATPAAPRRPLCLDSPRRVNSGPIRIRGCVDHANQKFVIDGGLIKVADTVGTASEMCIDAGTSRNDYDRVRIWECVPNQNQFWVIRDGSIVIKNTIGTAREMCIDVGTTRNTNDQVFLYQCGATNTNQKFVTQRGQIKVEDTL
ncbi:RICIN domain-containing protein [Microbispora sp. NPDC046933]|uniref:RICIN domain-containing protein n=1 Tax=Microbispora sp. NPDC046933 TaxID=3155618 RepID=UPI0033D77F03